MWSNTPSKSKTGARTIRYADNTRRKRKLAKGPPWVESAVSKSESYEMEWANNCELMIKAKANGPYGEPPRHPGETVSQGASSQDTAAENKRQINYKGRDVGGSRKEKDWKGRRK